MIILPTIEDLRGMVEGRQCPAIVSFLEVLDQRLAKLEKKIEKISEKKK